MGELTPRTLVFALENDSVWLGMKKRGFGAGKWNGYGGKVHAGETLLEAGVREFHEETTAQVDPENLFYLGFVDFFFKTNPHFDQRVHLYVTESWHGDIAETEEMASETFPVEELPLDEMWKGDDLFIPLVLDKKHVEATIVFDGDDDQQEVVEAHFDKPAEYSVSLE